MDVSKKKIDLKAHMNRRSGGKEQRQDFQTEGKCYDLSNLVSTDNNTE